MTFLVTCQLKFLILRPHMWYEILKWQKLTTYTITFKFVKSKHSTFSNNLVLTQSSHKYKDNMVIFRVKWQENLILVFIANLKSRFNTFTNSLTIESVTWVNKTKLAFLELMSNLTLLLFWNFPIPFLISEPISKRKPINSYQINFSTLGISLLYNLLNW